MKLTNSTIRNLIKKELLNLQEQGRIGPGMASPTHSSAPPTGAEVLAAEREEDALEKLDKAYANCVERGGTWSNNKCIPGGDLDLDPKPPARTPAQKRQDAVDKCNQLHPSGGKALEDCLLKIQGMTPKVDAAMAQQVEIFNNLMSVFPDFEPKANETFAQWYRASRKHLGAMLQAAKKYKKLSGEEMPEFVKARETLVRWVGSRGWTAKLKRAFRRREKRGGRQHRLTRKGLKILAKEGYKDFDDFYADLDKHNLMGILEKHGGADKKWGDMHAMALEKVKEAEKQAGEEEAARAEDQEKKGAEEKLIDDHHKKLARDAAQKIYQLIKGATWPSEKKEAHAVIKDLEGKGIDLANLYDAFSTHLSFEGDSDADEDLIQWLQGDGMNSDARKVAAAVRARKEKEAAKEAAKPKPSWKEKQRREAEARAADDAAAESGDPHNLEENTVYSSYSDSNKLFESWKRFTKSTKED